jgi:hypothetical protein
LLKLRPFACEYRELTPSNLISPLLQGSCDRGLRTIGAKLASGDCRMQVINDLMALYSIAPAGLLLLV